MDAATNSTVTSGRSVDTTADGFWGWNPTGRLVGDVDGFWGWNPTGR
ncbi:MAG: hypothetical protein M3Y49_01470 [Actinomycetota bacterium]|nr:hypothetical protein [Actinomycetota bacterium]